MKEISILITEPDNRQREHYSNYFNLQNSIENKKFNYNISYAGDGKEALDKLLSEKYFHFVIFEEQLPEIKATEVVKTLREKGVFINWVMITKKSSENLVIKSLRLGARNYWKKDNFEIEHLHKEIIKSISEDSSPITISGFDYNKFNFDKNISSYLFFKFEKSRKYINLNSQEYLEDVYKSIRSFIRKKVNEYNGLVIIKQSNAIMAIFNKDDDFTNNAVFCGIEIFSGLNTFNLSNETAMKGINYKLGIHQGVFNFEHNTETIISKDLNFCVHLLKNTKGYYYIISDIVYKELPDKLKAYFIRSGNYDNIATYNFKYW